jgi:hypothetical protein
MIAISVLKPIPDESYEDALHFLDAHVNVLNHTSVKHARWHMSTTSLLLQIVETLQDNALTTGEAIANIGHVVTRGSFTHPRFSSVCIPS